MIRSSFIVLLSFIAGRGSVVVAGIVISNVLGASAFAAFAFAHITASSISNIAAAGMQNAMPRYFARLAVDNRLDAVAHTVLAILFAAMGLAVAVVVVQLLPDEVIGMPVTVSKAIVVFLIVAVTFNNLSIGATNGLERFDYVAVATIAQGILLLIAAVLASYLRRVDIALWGYVVATVAAVAILLPPILRMVVARLRERGVRLNRKSAGEVAMFCGPLFLTTVLTSSGIWLTGRSVLGSDAGTQAFAEVALGLQWFGLGSMASNVISRVVVPRLTRQLYLKDGAGGLKTLLNATSLSITSTLLIFGAVLIFSEKILLLYGPDLANAKPVLVYFVLAAVVASPLEVITSSLISRNRPLCVALNYAVWWACLVSLLYLASDLNAQKVAHAFIVAYVISLCSGVITVRRCRALP